jgi:2,3,4,5-tetrahydropyridine-2,6-dicarboxylate N-succinyltransferase
MPVRPAPRDENLSSLLRDRVDALSERLTSGEPPAAIRSPQPSAPVAGDRRPAGDDGVPVVADLLSALESGLVRAALRRDDGLWEAVSWVKRGILMGFRLGVLADLSPREASGRQIPPFTFIDKDTFPTRAFSVEDGVRIVPGGTTVRRGAHLARGVTCMPPAFVNVGAFVGRDTMIDSHALVGSCAQIGERVHLSAGAQIGGVLEPINASPVVIEDDVVVGGNCGVYEGVVVRTRAVLGAGVIVTRSTPVYDLVRETVYRATPEAALEIPAGAVVVSGARPVGSPWGRAQGLTVSTPIIIKYRDAKTDAATALESALR